MSEQALVEGVLKSTIEDRDRDKSDAKDAVLEVASLIASDESLNRLVSAMRKSRYEHFRTAAREFRGRRETILRFLDRAGAVEVDGHPACDVGFGDILSVGQKMASDILDARRPHPITVTRRSRKGIVDQEHPYQVGGDKCSGPRGD